MLPQRISRQSTADVKHILDKAHNRLIYNDMRIYFKSLSTRGLCSVAGRERRVAPARSPGVGS